MNTQKRSNSNKNTEIGDSSQYLRNKLENFHGQKGQQLRHQPTLLATMLSVGDHQKDQILISKRQSVNNNDGNENKRTSNSNIPSVINVRKDISSNGKSKMKSSYSLLFECFSRIRRIFQKRSIEVEAGGGCHRRRHLCRNSSHYIASSVSSTFFTFLDNATTNNKDDDIIKRLEEAEEFINKVKELGYSPENMAKLVLNESFSTRENHRYSNDTRE